VTITATPAEHCIFVRWDDGNTDAVRDIIVTEDVTYTAIFQALPQYEVTVSVAPEGAGTVLGAGSYYAGETVTLTATANEGYYLLGWDYAENTTHDAYLSTAATYTFTMGEADVNLVALFAEMPDTASLIAIVNNSEWGYILINGVRTDHYSGFEGDTVYLEAVAEAGYHFDNWEVPENAVVEGTTVTIVLSEAATNVTCNFAENGVGIDDVEEDNIVIYSENRSIVVRGAEQEIVRVFDVVGRLIDQRTAVGVEETIQMPATGVYLVKIGNRPARRVVVRR